MDSNKIVNKMKFDSLQKRKELEKIEVPRDDGMTSTGIYLGSFDNLSKVDDKILPWNHSEPTELDCGDYISLKEIADFFQKNGNPYREITVFMNEPQHGMIYQYGNYGDYWYEVGTLKGYC